MTEVSSVIVLELSAAFPASSIHPLAEEVQESFAPSVSDESVRSDCRRISVKIFFSALSLLQVHEKVPALDSVSLNENPCMLGLCGIRRSIVFDDQWLADFFFASPFTRNEIDGKAAWCFCMFTHLCHPHFPFQCPRETHRPVIRIFCAIYRDVVIHHISCAAGFLHGVFHISLQFVDRGDGFR